MVLGKEDAGRRLEFDGVKFIWDVRKYKGAQGHLTSHVAGISGLTLTRVQMLVQMRATKHLTEADITKLAEYADLDIANYWIEPHCARCDESFKDLSGFKSHRRLVHGGQ